MRKYYFYFDESFHDRKITNKNDNCLNIYGKDNSDAFIGAFIGINEFNIKIFESMFEKFEIKYKNVFDINLENELKPVQVIKRKNFIYGLANLNKNAIELYSEYFNILLSVDCKFQLDFFSKIEFLILSILENVKFKNPYILKTSFIYSVVKFLDKYRYLKIQNKLLKSENLTKQDIVKNLRKGLLTVERKIIGINRKEEEINAIKQMLFILDDIELQINKCEEVLWDYTRIFTGFNLLLDELEIEQKNVEVFLDREGTGKILEAGCNFEYKIENYESHKVIGIRGADILANFFGRLVYAIQEEFKEDNSGEISKERKLVSAKWFALSKEQFNLVKTIFKLFDKQSYWSTYSSIYDDNSFSVFSYIHYINIYNNYREYMDIKNHWKRGNNFMINMLKEHLREKER